MCETHKGNRKVRKFHEFLWTFGFSTNSSGVLSSEGIGRTSDCVGTWLETHVCCLELQIQAGWSPTPAVLWDGITFLGPLWEGAVEGGVDHGGIGFAQRSRSRSVLSARTLDRETSCQMLADCRQAGSEIPPLHDALQLLKWHSSFSTTAMVALPMFFASASTSSA